MNPKAIELQKRTHRFFVRVTRFCESLPRNSTTISIANQLTDSAGSVDSNYRAACRARTLDEFISKIAVAAEEADESEGWLSALMARSYGNAEETQALIQESGELTAIFTASHKTARKNREAHQTQQSREKALRRRR